MNLFIHVLRFMSKFNQSTPEAPVEPSDALIRQRTKWTIEEAFELLEASFAEGREVRQLRAYVFDFIENATVKVDLVKYADANGDIRFLAYGNDIAAGIDSRDIDAEISRSNDTKSMPPEKGEKIIKGPNYQPPHIEAILREQGWKGAT